MILTCLSRKFGENSIIPPATNYKFTIIAEQYFRVRQIVIPHNIAERLVVTELSMGRLSQMASVGCVPAMLFSDRAATESYDLDPVSAGGEISISLTNLSEVPTEFEVAFMGHTERDVCPDRRRSFFGLGATDIRPGEYCNITVRPHIAFRSERLVVPSTIADHFDVIDIKVGYNSQLLSPGSIPAKQYTEKVPQSSEKVLCRDVCQPSVFHTVAVCNNSSKTQVFTGAMVGTAIY
jgi:hypothetical protein